MVADVHMVTHALSGAFLYPGSDDGKAQTHHMAFNVGS